MASCRPGAAAALSLHPLRAQTGFPFPSDESLHYSINWPSGLSLGDATLSAHRTSKGWNFAASLDAGVPGFAIADKYRSTVAGNDLCSTEFERDLTHGAKHTLDKLTFDQQQRTGAAHHGSSGGRRQDRFRYSLLRPRRPGLRLPRPPRNGPGPHGARPAGVSSARPIR